MNTQGWGNFSMSDWRGTPPTAWRNELPEGKMVGPCQSVQSYVKCRCMVVFKELTSQGCGERHEKLPNCQDHACHFLCSPAVVTTFWSINSLSTSDWSEAWPQLPRVFWWSWSSRMSPATLVVLGRWGSVLLSSFPWCQSLGLNVNPFTKLM